MKKGNENLISERERDLKGLFLFGQREKGEKESPFFEMVGQGERDNRDEVRD
jgi:hypothetical protein